MANRRTLKKGVKAVCQNLLIDCLIICAQQPQRAEELETAIQQIALLNAEFVARINHTEKGNIRLFYKKFYEDFDRELLQLEKNIFNR